MTDGYDGPAKVVTGTVTFDVRARLATVAQGPAWWGRLTAESDGCELWDLYQAGAPVTLELPDGRAARARAAKYRLNTDELVIRGRDCAPF